MCGKVVLSVWCSGLRVTVAPDNTLYCGRVLLVIATPRIMPRPAQPRPQHRIIRGVVNPARSTHPRFILAQT